MLSWLKKDGAIAGTESYGESGMERAMVTKKQELY